MEAEIIMSDDRVRDKKKTFSLNLFKKLKFSSCLDESKNYLKFNSR